MLLIHNEAHDFRRNLVAKLSEDDGVTWSKPLLLDDAENPERSISYPDAATDADGRIFVIYDRGRNTCREILMAQITEEDILRGVLTRQDSYSGRIISKAPVPADQAKYESRREYARKWRAEYLEKLVP